MEEVYRVFVRLIEPFYPGMTGTPMRLTCNKVKTLKELSAGAAPTKKGDKNLEK